jgi:hypothetical protein
MEKSIRLVDIVPTHVHKGLSKFFFVIFFLQVVSSITGGDGQTNGSPHHLTLSSSFFVSAIGSSFFCFFASKLNCIQSIIVVRLVFK